MEIPVFMWSPHENGKLYKRNTFTKEIKVGEDIIKAELNKYVNFKEFRWVIEGDSQHGNSQPLQGLPVDDTYMPIKTNSLDEFVVGDILWLKCAGRFPKGRYFIITDPVKQDYGYFPKERKTYKHVSLKALL